MPSKQNGLVEKPKLILVEDDAYYSKYLEDRLRLDFSVLQSPTIENSQIIIEDNFFDIAIIDRVLPDGDGLELLYYLERVAPQTRVLVLSAQASLCEKLHGLSSGADVYLTKPTHPDIIRAQAKALLRRGRIYQDQKMRYDDLTFHLDQNQVSRNSKNVILTKREGQILKAFLETPQCFLTKHQIHDIFWDNGGNANDSMLHVSIQRLRRRLEKVHIHINCQYGKGYQLSLD